MGDLGKNKELVRVRPDLSRATTGRNSKRAYPGRAQASYGGNREQGEEDWRPGLGPDCINGNFTARPTKPPEVSACWHIACHPLGLGGGNLGPTRRGSAATSSVIRPAPEYSRHLG